MTAWTNAVSAAFKGGRAKDKNFTLKMAMMAAKKTYKKQGTNKKRGGGVADNAAPVADSKVPLHIKGGKSRKTRRSSSKSRK